MAIKFEELRKYVARNVRLSICFEDGYYHDYLMMSDIPEPVSYTHLCTLFYKAVYGAFIY